MITFIFSIISFIIGTFGGVLLTVLLVLNQEYHDIEEELKDKTETR